jgi:hypothetical protein
MFDSWTIKSQGMLAIKRKPAPRRLSCQTINAAMLGAVPFRYRLAHGVCSFSIRLICITICLFACALKADDSRIAALYEQFLAGSNSSGFVVFEKTQIAPKPIHVPSIRMPNGTVVC